MLAVLVTLAGCAPSNDPSRYTDEVRENFLTACTEGSQGKLGEQAARDYCTCVYDDISRPEEQGGIAFDDFKKLDDELRDRIGDDVNNADDLATVNQRYRDIIGICSSAGPRPVTTTTGATTTTSR